MNKQGNNGSYPDFAILSPQEANEGWLDFFLNEEIDSEDEVWFTQEVPEVMEARRTLSAEQFANWFLTWAEQRWG